MSDFDRNIATARTGYRTDQVAIDAGLRAYMIRVYNYMAVGVALTGVVSWLTYQALVAMPSKSPATGITGLTAFGQAIFGGPLTIVLFVGTLGLVFFLASASTGSRPGTALGCSSLRRPARTDAVVDISQLHRHVDHARVLHLGGDVRRDESLRLHHAARSLADRLVPDHGSDRHHHRDAGQHVPAESSGLNFAISVIGVLIFARPHRLGHAADQGDVRRK
jgi:hypothetical protein